MLFLGVEPVFQDEEPVFQGVESVFHALEQENVLGTRKNKTKLVNKNCIVIEIIRKGKPSTNVNNYTNIVN